MVGNSCDSPVNISCVTLMIVVAEVVLLALFHLIFILTMTLGFVSFPLVENCVFSDPRWRGDVK